MTCPEVIRALVPLGLTLLLSACVTPPEDELADPRPEPPAGPTYRVEDGAVRNRDGEALFLRGVNLSQVSKYGPDYRYPLTLDDAAIMLEHGFNSVRLLTLWEAIMPRGPGRVDQEYLDELTHQVWMLESMGLLVVVDMHQDLWGPPFGDGAPEWTCPEEIRRGYEPSSPWWSNYTTPQVTGCFDLFWESSELQDHFIEAWTAAAGAVCRHRNVVGFDLLNEPWPGSALGDPRFDNEVLFPFYLRVIDAIDEVCPGRVFFVEPLITFSLGLSDPLELPEDARDRVVLAPHHYPTDVHEPGEGYQGDLAELEERFLGLFDEILESGQPVWIGEWGGMTTNPRFDQYVQDTSEIFLRHFVGSALWEYSRGATSFSLLSPDGTFREAFQSFRQMPTPTTLPEIPERVEPDWEERELLVRVRCRAGARVSLVIPGSGQATCAAEPEDALWTRPALPAFFNARCRRDETVTLRCRAER